MKRFLLLTLCAALLLGAAIPAYADVDFSWWKYIPGATDPGKATATPKPTATPKTSSSCSMCDGTGYTALKTGTGEYVAVACPQCSNNGGGTSTNTTTTTTTTNTNNFDNIVQAYIDYCKQQAPKYDIDFAYPVHDTESEAYYVEVFDEYSDYRLYRTSDWGMTLTFISKNNSGMVDEISVDCKNPADMRTTVLTFLFIAQATGQLTQDCIDWVWDTADDMVDAKGSDRLFYPLGSNTILFTRILNDAYAKYAYTYSITIY